MVATHAETSAETGQAAAVARPHRLAAALFGGVLVVWLGLIALVLRAAALPPEAAGTVLAVFPPGIAEEDAFRAIVWAGGNPVRRVDLPGTWVVNDEAPGFAGRLDEAGAILVLGELPLGLGPGLAGCTALMVDVGEPVAAARR